MRNVVIPRNVPSDVQRAFQQVNLGLQHLDIPVLKDMSSVRGISEGTAAYFLEGSVLYRYTKIGGKLHKEKVAIEDLPEPIRIYSSEIQEALVDQMPIRLKQPVKVVEVDDNNVVRVDLEEDIEENEGEPRFEFLQAREIAANGFQGVPVMDVAIDGKVFYCVEGNFFNKILLVETRIRDERVISDTDRPTVRIETVSTYTTTDAIEFKIIFSKVVYGFSEEDIIVSGGTLSNFSGNAATYVCTVTPTGTQTISLRINQNVAIDDFNNFNTGSTQVNIAYIPPDRIRPTAGISGPSFYKGTNPFDVSFPFSERVNGFSASGVRVVGGRLGSLTQDGNTFRSQITPTGTGIITVQVLANAARDTAGNTNEASAIHSIATIPNPLRNPSVEVDDGEIHFRFDASDNANGSPILSNEVRIGTGDWIDIGLATSYTFPGLMNGQSHQVQGRCRNLVGYSTEITVSGTPIAIDRTRPEVDIVAPATYSDAFDIGIPFSENVSGFVIGDISIQGGTLGNFTGQDNGYKARVTPIGTGQITIRIPENVCQDTAGNLNRASDPVIVRYVASARISDPVQDLVLTAGDRQILAEWKAPANDGGSAIRRYWVQVDTGIKIDVGLNTRHPFLNLFNGQEYRISVYAENGVGETEPVTLTATPEEEGSDEPILRINIVEFEEDIIGNPERERQFWSNQGHHATCAAVACGSAMRALGVEGHDDSLQVVRDSVKLVDQNNNHLPDVVNIRYRQDPLYGIVRGGNQYTIRPVSNTPSLTIRGEAIYYRKAVPVADWERFYHEPFYDLQFISFNPDRIYASNSLSRIAGGTGLEISDTSSWNVVNLFFDHYDVPHHVGYCYDFSWLIREIESGNKVIAFVDLREFRNPSIIEAAQAASDFTTIEPGNNNPAAQIRSLQNHAVWITGIDVSVPTDPQIIINDSSRTTGGGDRYSLQTFLASWEDAEFIYTATGASLPDLPTISGVALNREHRQLNRIIKLHRRDLFKDGKLEVLPFFDNMLEQYFLDRIGIKDRYNRYLRHVALEQKRIFDTYGLDSTQVKNVLDILVHE